MEARDKELAKSADPDLDFQVHCYFPLSERAAAGTQYMQYAEGEPAA